MNRVGLLSSTVLGAVAFASLARAQTTPPPPPPPPPPPAATTPGPDVPGAAPAPPASGTTPASPAPPVAGGASVNAAASASTDTGWNLAAEPSSEEADAPQANENLEDTEAERRGSLQIQNTISGSTGMLRVTQAGSGAPGTFRFSLLTGIFSGSGVLCTSENPCPSAFGEDPGAPDDLDALTAHLGISATVLPFLEGYLGFHNRASSNSRSRPQLLQVLGDANLGVKGFLPPEPDRIFSVGGELELWLLNGTGGVGLDGAGTSFAIRGLATLDASNRVSEADRTPLRAHLNLAYRFDNSSNLVQDLEETSAPGGRGTRISRIERFGLGVNRVDFFEIGLGAEYVHPVIRPFLEWSLDAPLNRKGYVCNIDDANDRGDSCLKLEEGLAISPSRLTLGARLFPWEGRGLGLLAAFDVGTSGTATFIDETVPELPWTFWLGLSYAVDTQPPKPVIERVSAPAAVATVENYVQGSVLEKGAKTPVANAVVRYDGRPITGMVTDELGAFRTTKLLPGTYTFGISAPGYRGGQCSVTIPTESAPRPTPGPGNSGLPNQPIRPGSLPAEQGQIVIPLQCELEALPKLGTIVGSLFDGETNQPVPGARIKVIDRKNRELMLPGDTSGAFRVENVPQGRVRVAIEAAGYFPSVTELEIKPQDELQTRIMLNKRPAQPNVLVAGREMKLKKQVHFETDSAKILPDSMALIEEIADVLKSRTEITSVEVQGHTDNTGTPPHNLRLSQDRAQAVVDALIRLNVDPTRLVAKGYGQEKPLLPNVSEMYRARNRRVQLMIQK